MARLQISSGKSHGSDGVYFESVLTSRWNLQFWHDDVGNGFQHSGP